MLSRTADHLYWMSRWIERGEALARMLDAHHRHSLLPVARFGGWALLIALLAWLMERGD